MADAQFVAENISLDSKLLDIGAVPPLMVAVLRQLGLNSLNICDPLPNSFTSFCKTQNVGFHQVDLINEPPPPTLHGYFDFVCLNEVVEHLAGNLVSAVESVASCVKPKGHLLVTTPNLRSLSGFTALLHNQSGLASKPHDTVRQQYERQSAEWGYYGHLREFTQKEIIDFIESFGFRLVATKMQANYLNRGRLHGLVSRLEMIAPKYRLFGKYLFKKTD